MTNRIRVMFVDDEPNILNGLERMLSGQIDEWDIVFAPSGFDALAILSQKPVDVIVSDMRMPEMDGAELLSEIERNYPKTIRIILSGQSDRTTSLRSVGPTHVFLTKPCDKNQVIRTIKRALHLRQVLRNERLVMLVSSLRTIPTPPKTYYEIMQALRNPNTPLDIIGDIISKDMALTAKLLQLTNSAFFGVSYDVRTPRQAVNLLGLDTIHTLVLSCGVMTQFAPSSMGGQLFTQMWAHSQEVGRLAKLIAMEEKFPATMIDEVFIAGILHDIGTLVMAANLSHEYSKVIEQKVEKGLSVSAAELEVFGVTHAEVGAYLLGLWGLRDELVEAVAYHGHPWDCFQPDAPMVWCVYAANTLVHSTASSSESEGHLVNRDYLKSIGKEHRWPVWEKLAEGLYQVPLLTNPNA